MMMKRRRLLANYGKLVIYGVIPIGEAAEIFEQYVKVSRVLNTRQSHFHFSIIKTLEIL